MLLNQIAHFNDLSPKLRDELDAKIKGFGKSVRYKFDIANKNPAPTGDHDKIIYPNMYTLDPSVFNINDPYEDRKDKQKSKRIGLIKEVDEKGLPKSFKKCQVYGKTKGILSLNVEEDNDDFNMAMFIEIHPKLTGGMFMDKTKRQVITRIDENKLATEQRAERSLRSKARRAAEEMSDNEIVNFCDAMMWDSTRDMAIMRNEVEALAESDPPFFNDMIKEKTVEFQSLVKQAMDRNIITFDPAENKFSYTSNGQPIAIFSAADNKNEVQKMSEFLQAGGGKAEEVHKKIKSLLKKAEVAV